MKVRIFVLHQEQNVSTWIQLEDKSQLLLPPTKVPRGPVAAFGAGSSLVALRKAGGEVAQGTLRALRWLDAGLGICLGCSD